MYLFIFRPFHSNGEKTQIRLHPYNYAANISLLDYHYKHNIVTEAFGSLAFVFHPCSIQEQNFFLLIKLSLSSITTLPGGPVDAPVQKAAQRLGIAPAQVIFLWVKAKGAVIVTSVKKKNVL